MSQNDITYVLRARNEAKKVFDQFGKGLKESATDAKRLREETRRGATEADRLAKETSRVGKGMTVARAEAAALRTVLQSVVGLVAGIGVGFLIAGEINAAIGTAAQFESQMSEVRAVTQATASEFALLNDRARGLGESTSFSASEVAAGQAFLARAGFEVLQVYEAIPTALGLARAGQLELAEAADIASNVISGLRIEVSEFDRVADVLAATSATSNTNIRQLGLAFSFVAPQLADLKISAEEGASAIGILSNAGIQGARAGTNLRGVLARLIKPTKEARDEMARLGIDLEKIDPTANDLVSVLRELEPVAGNAASAARIFGVEIGSGASVLVGMVDELETLIQINKDAEGSLDTLAFVMGDNLQGSVKELSSAWEELRLALVDTGFLRNVVQFLTALVRTITPAREEVDAFGMSAGTAAEFMEDMRQRAEELRQKMEDFRRAAETVVEVVKILGQVLGALVAIRVIRGLAQIVSSLVTIRRTASFAGMLVNGHPLVRMLNIAATAAITLLGYLRNIDSFASRAAETASGMGVEALREEIAKLERNRRQSTRVGPQPGMSQSEIVAARGRSARFFTENDQVRLDALRERLTELTTTTGDPRALSGIPGSELLPPRPPTTLSGDPEVPDYDTDVTSSGSGGGSNPRDNAQAVRDFVARLREERRALKGVEEARLGVRQAIEFVNDARAQGVPLTEEQIGLILQEADALEQVRKESESFLGGMERGIRDFADDAMTAADFARTSIETITDSLRSSLARSLDEGSLRFSSFFNSLRSSINQFIADQAVLAVLNIAGNALVSGGLGGSFSDALTSQTSFFAPRAGGGGVEPGREYRVGERGVERFRPMVRGQILPGGGDQPVIVQNTTQVIVNDQAGVEVQARDAGGGRIELTLYRIVDKGISSGAFDKAFGQRFGARPVPRG